jgi:hypothetical protein
MAPKGMRAKTDIGTLIIVFPDWPHNVSFSGGPRSGPSAATD